MNNIVIAKKSYLLPSNWQEVTSQHLMAAAPFLLGSDTRLDQRKFLCLKALLPVLNRYWMHNKWVTRLINKWPKLQIIYPLFTDGQKWDLLQTVNYLFTDISGRSVITEFAHKGVTYLMPADNLLRESIIAFAFADEYFSQFAQTGDSKYIDLLIGCLARQRGSNEYPAIQVAEGDQREHFSTSRTKERAQAFKDLDVNIRNAVLIYFMGSKKFLHQQYAIIFEQVKEKDDAGAGRQVFGKKIIPKPDYGWIGVIYDLAEQGTFGNFDQVKHMFLHTCCYYLAKKKYQHEEQTS